MLTDDDENEENQENDDAFDIPTFQITMTLEQINGFGNRNRVLEESEYRNELLNLIYAHMRQTGDDGLNMESLMLVYKALTQSSDGDVITAVFDGTATTRSTTPSTDEKSSWVLNSFNSIAEKELFITSLKNAGHVTLEDVVDVSASLLIGEENGETEDTTTLTLSAGNSTGLISGMVVGIFVISTLAGFAYRRRRQNKSRSNGYYVSDFYNSTEDHDDDGNPTIDSSYNNSPSKSLKHIAAGSVNKDSDYASAKFNGKVTSMSKLAAGATQEEFAQNGMNVDVYGQNINRKKKKRSSPLANGRKGAEMSTDLDPIVEVSSSVASSVTDDKMVKGDLNVPQLLPALSVSSCPSDESYIQRLAYSQTGVPALTAMTPDPLMDEFMSPSIDNHIASTDIEHFTKGVASSQNDSPVRKLNFAAFDSDKSSDKSSDSGVQDLLAFENRVVMSEEEALKASLITFVNDNCTSSEKSVYDSDEENVNDGFLKTLGVEVVGADTKDSAPILSKEDEDCDTTILVLSKKIQSNKR